MFNRLGIVCLPWQEYKHHKGRDLVYPILYGDLTLKKKKEISEIKETEKYLKKKKKERQRLIQPKHSHPQLQ